MQCSLCKIFDNSATIEASSLLLGISDSTKVYAFCSLYLYVFGREIEVDLELKPSKLSRSESYLENLVLHQLVTMKFGTINETDKSSHSSKGKIEIVIQDQAPGCPKQRITA